VGKAKTAPVTADMRKMLEAAEKNPTDCLDSAGTPHDGLSAAMAERIIAEVGPNVVAAERKPTMASRLAQAIFNPLVLLMAGLAAFAYLTEDHSAAYTILALVTMGVGLRFTQERRSDAAAERLKSLIGTKVTVLRSGEKIDIALHEVVPGDLVHLSAGDMVPADIRLVSAKDLFVNQASLTGEALPMEKSPAPAKIASGMSAYDLPPLAFMGSNIVSGTGLGLVIATGAATGFGTVASSLGRTREVTDFDKGISKFTWLMIGFIAVLVPVVFLANGLVRRNWLEAFLFATAVAVGLTPEMLPMIVTVNLSKGAVAMSRKKVIVKRLDAIQNFGAMDVLCTDKTGTITEGRVVLMRHIDIDGREDEKTLNYAFLNSFFQTGLKNLLDAAIIDHVHSKAPATSAEGYVKVDEIPFDFARRRMSVVVEQATEGEKTEKGHLLICKGAIEELLPLVTSCELHGEVLPFTPERNAGILALSTALAEEGFRVVALAYRKLPPVEGAVYGVADERDLTLLGFLAFLDPPKATAPQAIANLESDAVGIKVLTGDNGTVAASICRQVGIPTGRILTGPQLDTMDDAALDASVDEVSLFAKLSPFHKERVVRALKRKGHVVGFMGDGINDAPALRAADVGISVDSAVDVAKESSDIILLENSLVALHEGVREGRKVFGNITKYIRMAASSNFGNMFSILGASLFLPFVPLLPIQVLTNNFLYDLSQTAIPSDNVDPDWLSKPRRWDIGDLRRFILFIGPISSIFDYLTFFVLLRFFGGAENPALFRAGWFVESIFTQSLIVHVIRTDRIPFLQSRASRPLTVATLAVMAVGAMLTLPPFASVIGFAPLPLTYWLYVVLMIPAYLALTQVAKSWFNRRSRRVSLSPPH